MAVVSTGLSEAGLRGNFFQRYEEVNKQVHFEQLSTRIPSTSDSEKYKFLGSVPPMREWGTGRKARGLGSESYSVANLKYENTLEVDRVEIEDDQTAQIAIRIRELADRAATHKDTLLGQLLVNGASVGYNSYDGVPFFGATHESYKSGAQSNVLTPAAVAPTTPTTAEFRAALGSAIAALLSLKDDQGEPMSMGAAGLVAVVPPSMLITASEAINATIVDATSNVLSGAAKIIAFPHLTAGETFYLLKTDVAVRPFIFQDRIPLEFTALERESDEGFMRDKYLYGVRARYRITYGYWQYALKLTFTE